MEVSADDIIRVRDSQDRNGVVLTISADVWRALAEELKRRLVLARSCSQRGSAQQRSARRVRR